MHSSPSRAAVGEKETAPEFVRFDQRRDFSVCIFYIFQAVFIKNYLKNVPKCGIIVHGERRSHRGIVRSPKNA